MTLAVLGGDWFDPPSGMHLRDPSRRTALRYRATRRVLQVSPADWCAPQVVAALLWLIHLDS